MLCGITTVDPADEDIHYTAKSVWTSDFHTHMCLVNFPFKNPSHLYAFAALTASSLLGSLFTGVWNVAVGIYSVTLRTQCAV